ncbi:MAG: NAD(+)/NADH kinase [Oscillospiraceae bacterium]
MIILIVPNLNKANAVDVTDNVIKDLLSFGAEVIMEKAMEPFFDNIAVRFYNMKSAYQKADVIVTVGGDGTILHTALDSLSYEKPLLGVNLGRMGFLATAEANEPFKLKRLVDGDYTLDERVLLEANLQGGKNIQKTALNDVVISRSNTSQIIDVDIFCDEILASSYRGDGVVISTPTGSTAYSLSAGGPVLDAKISGIVVTPICAHSLNSPSMVFSEGRNLRIAVSSETQSSVNVFMSCDGSKPIQINSDDKLTVALSKKFITLICFNEADQFEAIDKKLKGR